MSSNMERTGAYAPTGIGIPAERSAFLTKTYNHLFGAILLFVALQVLYFKTGIAATLAQVLLGVNWLFVLGGFVVVS